MERKSADMLKSFGQNETGYAFHKQKKKIRRETILAYVFVLTPLVAYAIFQLVPMAISFAVQFFDMEYYDLTSLQWNNFANFKYVFEDSRFWLSIRNTLFFTLAQFVSLAVALTISVVLNNKPVGRKIFYVVYFIPYICSTIAVGLMWKWMFNGEHGIINTILTGLGGKAVEWFNDPKAYPWMIFIVSVWQAPGYGIVMYRSALNTIPKSSYEAADLEGANFWQKFWKITFPAISSTTFYLIMVGIIAGLQSFDIAKIFMNNAWGDVAGPDNSGLTTVLYIYIEGISWNNMPHAAVASWMLFIVIFVISLINNKLKKKWVNE